ncbi:hypothetical protein CKJ54_16395 [Mycobacterium marseillense]|uniref:Uncharacterized protein n=2 Tax=Mycobacterium marseillense TaxID=701042 RepID=A0AAC9YPE4_9MYCO|nr:hypothetical protein CKJ54_16395 [Mycobacterium marseillense]
MQGPFGYVLTPSNHKENTVSAIPFPYGASPPTTDAAERVRELEIQARRFRAIIAEQDAELAKRDKLINELITEAADKA